MVWDNGSGRTATPEAKRWARAVKRRDGYQCQRCGYEGRPDDGVMKADHRIPVAEGGAEFDLANGETLCDPCHKPKTAAEAARGRARTGRKRPAEAHPGLITRP